MGGVSAEVVFGDGSTTTLRFTGVLHLEDGIWRFVQSHLSVGATNEETIGYEMTTTIETLAAAVQEERPDLAEATAADGTVTIAFSDLEGFNRVGGASRGSEVARPAALARSRRRARRDARRRPRRQIPRRRTHAGVPVRAPRALRTAIEIQRSLREPHEGEALRLRIGLHSGEVLQHADDLFGRTVIMAARVAAAARGAEILTSSRLFELTAGRRTHSHSECPRTTQLKGIPGEHRLFPLIWNEISPTGVDISR